jgi:EpsI family protein
VVIANGEHRALVYYWFDQRGRFVTNEWLVKWYLFRDALLTRKTYGAMVRVMTPLLPDETAEHAQIRLDGFLRAAQPDLLTFIPR